MIRTECATAADTLSASVAKVTNLAANGHFEIARGVLTSALRVATEQHAQCPGCDCQCDLREAKGVCTQPVPRTGSDAQAAT